jgi:hypothetical protein
MPAVVLKLLLLWELLHGKPTNNSFLNPIFLYPTYYMYRLAWIVTSIITVPPAFAIAKAGGAASNAGNSAPAAPAPA